MTIIWNDQPPASPPTTDADLCATWAPAAGASTHTHDHAHTDQPPAEDAAHDPAAPTAVEAAAEPTSGTPSPSEHQWFGYAAPTPPPPFPQTSPPPTRGNGARVALAGLAIAGLLGVGFGTKAMLDTSTPASTTATAATGAPATNAAAASSTPLVNGSDEEPVTAVATALGPSVVLIKTEEGLGSGVVYDAKGLIMTNAHVVGTASTVKVQFKDGSTLEGQVLGADVANDIAVVQVQPTTELTVARLAADPAKVGQLAVGIGSPFGLDETVTAGVVSAVNRPVDNGNGGVASMIQTDAPINPGNSGGALANRHGEVIGINSMIYSEKGENNGIGFAIPIARAKSVADTLVSGGTVDRGYLGVGSQPTSDGSAGAEITKVDAGSAAERGGLKSGDVVVSVDGTTIKQASDLAAAVGTHQAGDTIKVDVQRNGSTTTLDVTLGSKPAGDSTQATPQQQTPQQQTPQQQTPKQSPQTPKRSTPPSTQPG